MPQLRWPIRQRDRFTANAILRQFAHDCPQRVALVDIESAWDQAVQENAKFWSKDFVHLSKAGYADLARLIYEAMQRFQVNDEGEGDSKDKGKGKDAPALACSNEAYLEA